MQPILFLKILIIHLSLNWFSHDLTSFYFKFFPSTASKLKLDLSILAPPDTVVPSSTEFFIRSAGLLVGPVDISSFFFPWLASKVELDSHRRTRPRVEATGLLNSPRRSVAGAMLIKKRASKRITCARNRRAIRLRIKPSR